MNSLSEEHKVEHTILDMLFAYFKDVNDCPDEDVDVDVVPTKATNEAANALMLEDEIVKAIDGPQTNKACGIDNVLKSSKAFSSTCVWKLYNHVWYQAYLLKQMWTR